MTFSILNIILTIVLLITVPLAIGCGVSDVLKQEKTVSKSYVIGYVAMWAVCQIVAVPTILLKQSFFFVVIIISVIYIFLFGVSTWKKSWNDLFRFDKLSISQYVAIAITSIVVCILLVYIILLQHTDADDSRFVVNAVDILRTNKMFLTNPATGQALDIWQGELSRDVISPWAVYIAYCGKITGIHPTVMAHTILPVFLIIGVCAVYWLLSEVFFHKDVVHRCIFMCILILLDVYGYCSIYTAETFMLTRIWQGKAVVAAWGIPWLLYLFIQMYQTERYRDYFVLLTITELALCMLSGMGILLGAVMSGCFGLIYGILKKNVKIMLSIWLSVIPNVLFYGLTLVV